MRLWKAGGRCTLGGVNGRVGGDGDGAAPAVRVLDVPSAVAAGPTAFL